MQDQRLQADPGQPRDMIFQEFSNLVADKKHTNPIWFQLESDSPSSMEDISQLEANIGTQLPDEYKQFTTKYGSGHFAFGIVYSPDRSSAFSLENENLKNRGIRKNYIIFSENGSGDYYGFRSKEEKCSSEVFFWDHESEEWSETEHFNLFAFLASIALNSR